MLCTSCAQPLPPSDLLPSLGKTKLLRELLRASATPSDPSYLRSEIDSSSLVLAQYDAEIQRAEETLHAMITERHKLQNYLDGCRSAIAPVRRLSAETLCSVFELCASPSLPSTPEGELRNLVKIDLLTTSRVCSYWHHLVFGTPALWSEIDINIDHWPREPARAEHFLRALRACLVRGKMSPLKLNLYLPLVPPILLPLFALFEEHSNRWRHVGLIMPRSNLEQFSGAKGRFNALEHLMLHVLDGDAEPSGPINLFLDAPRLRKIDFLVTDTMELPEIAWPQIVWYCYSSIGKHGFEGFTNVMTKLPLGATFQLHVCQRNSPDKEAPHFLALTSHIFSLEVEMDVAYSQRAADLLSAVLKCLTLPHLQKLAFPPLPLHGPAVEWPKEEFISLALRSGFHGILRSLDVSGIMLSEDDLLSSLSHLQLLESLIVTDYVARHIFRWQDVDFTILTDELLLRLTWTPEGSESVLIPRLKHLVCTSKFSFTPKIYYDFVASRIALNGTSMQFYNSLALPQTYRRTSRERADEVVQCLQPLVAARTLRLFYTPPSTEPQEDEMESESENSYGSGEGEEET